jgi:PrgI family protein
VAEYKLIQDIEAEDKILGPLTLRQFIFAMIAVFLLYLCFIALTKHVIFLLAIFLPPAIFFGFFALPFGRDQPTEVWFLAKLRFWFKPRRRVWNQSGIKELVTITAPKKVEPVLTNGLSQTEVHSRLQALAQTLDSRGWAVKHATDPEVYTPSVVMSGSSDRLLGLDSLPQEVPSDDNANPQDMLDETASPIARQFDNMINHSSQVRRQELVSRLSGLGATPSGTVQAANSPWFMSQPSTPSLVPTLAAAMPSGSVAADDDDLAARLAVQKNSRAGSLGNLRTVQPAAARLPVSTAPAVGTDFVAARQTAPPMTPMTRPDDPAILSLARNNDLDVATLAREAKKGWPGRSGNGRSSDEVVIPLH